MKADKALWVYVEQQQGIPHKISLNLIHKAGALIAGDPDYSLAAVVTGHGLDKCVEKLSALGVDTVYVADDISLAEENHLGCAAVLAPLIQQEKPDIFLFPASDKASLLAATLGGRLKLGLMAHCVDLQLNEQGLLVGVIPAFGGNMLGEIFCPDSRPQMATARLEAPAFSRRQQKPCRIVSLDTAPAKLPPRLKLLETGVLEQDGPNLEDAEFIVCGGAGIADADGWRLLEEVAGLLGAAVGCTRPPIDKGWAGGEHIMIGTSGKYVKPQLYLGVGVSGMSHHICGMQDSNLILSVNNDSGAAIFGVSDYGFLADSTELLAALKNNLS